MTLLRDFLPLIAFFAAYKLGDIYIATGVLIVLTLLQSGWIWFRERRVPRMQLITAGLVLVFGGATIWLQDDWFIRIKPTVVYLLFAAAFALSAFVGDPPRTLVERAMGEAMKMHAHAWKRLNDMWVLFFLALGALNLYVALSFDQETWVNFKVFGLLGLTLAFLILQGVWLTRHAEFETEDGEQD